MTRILNIGSINIDHVYAVPHFLQAGETLSSTDMQIFPGGKGMNQSIALARAGGQVSHAGMVGSDGADLVELMRRSGVDTALTETVDGPTGHTVIQVTPEGQNCILLYPGANHRLDRTFLERALADFGPGDILVLQNEVSGIAEAMGIAHTKGMRIAFNPSPIGPEIADYPLETVRWFLLNEIEGNALTGETAPDAILDAMARNYPGAEVVLTLGKAGVWYRADSGDYHHGIYRVPVADTTAAGDTFTGYFISAVAAGEPPEEALRLASVASSIAVSRPGAAVSIPTIIEVRGSALVAEPK